MDLQHEKWKNFLPFLPLLSHNCFVQSSRRDQYKCLCCFICPFQAHSYFSRGHFFSPFRFEFVSVYCSGHISKLNCSRFYSRALYNTDNRIKLLTVIFHSVLSQWYEVKKLGLCSAPRNTRTTEITLPNLQTCNISHVFFQTSQATLVQPLS